MPLLAIHCGWGDWVYGQCSKECGTGTRTNTRVKLVEEEHGGTCDGQPSEIEECNTDPCPSTITALFNHFLFFNHNIFYDICPFNLS